MGWPLHSCVQCTEVYPRGNTVDFFIHMYTYVSLFISLPMRSLVEFCVDHMKAHSRGNTFECMSYTYTIRYSYILQCDILPPYASDRLRYNVVVGMVSDHWPVVGEW